MAYRRGRAGIGRVKGGPKFGAKAEEIKAVSLASAKETVKQLEEKLSSFAKKHKKQIQEDPAFRKKFLEMCAPLGVDPLSSKKGFWDGVLGIGEFYYELAVKVAEVCLASRTRNGGIMSVAEVQSILRKRGTKFRFSQEDGKKGNSNSGMKYSREDIVTAIGKLSKLKSGFKTVQVGATTMVISVPTELDEDHKEVMSIAQDIASGISVETVTRKTGWKEERAKRALDLLLSEGMAWFDEYKGEEYYWFPSVWKDSLSTTEDLDL
jgi:ESCRT-II complex subunit VPS22